ncbi:MAG: hypothetical protein K0R14_1412 [Burkholderiales bacterium]|jgi:hypothetical protein|nr:hypothetical protein [Burkholderiales bacterium]
MKRTKYYFLLNLFFMLFLSMNTAMADETGKCSFTVSPDSGVLINKLVVGTPCNDTTCSFNWAYYVDRKISQTNITGSDFLGSPAIKVVDGSVKQFSFAFKDSENKRVDFTFALASTGYLKSNWRLTLKSDDKLYIDKEEVKCDMSYNIERPAPFEPIKHISKVELKLKNKDAPMILKTKSIEWGITKDGKFMVILNDRPIVKPFSKLELELNGDYSITVDDPDPFGRPVEGVRNKIKLTAMFTKVNGSIKDGLAVEYYKEENKEESGWVKEKTDTVISDINFSLSQLPPKEPNEKKG